MASAYKRGNRWWIHYRDAISDLADARDSERLNLWARRDSNPLPPASEAGTLSR